MCFFSRTFHGHFTDTFLNRYDFLLHYYVLNDIIVVTIRKRLLCKMAKQRLTISLSEEVLKQLEEMSKETGLSKSAFITTLVNNRSNEKRKA